MNKDVRALLPHLSFSIMFSLSLKPRHGYELLQQIAEDSNGKVSLGAGALYGTLQRLAAENIIEEMPFEGDARRRYYRLTIKGWERLQADLAYYRHIVDLAVQRHHNL